MKTFKTVAVHRNRTWKETCRYFDSDVYKTETVCSTIYRINDT